MEQGGAQQKITRFTPLAPGTSLHHRYSVRGLLHADSCVMTYDGFDYVARQPVTILEFFPVEIAARAEASAALSPTGRTHGERYFFGMEAFYRQYDKIKQTIGSPNILSVFDVFFENGTAYAAAERPEGLTLAEYLDMRGEKLSCGELTYILRALADALLIVHSLNILHHGISERSILLCTDGTVKLIGFAAGRRTVEDCRAVRDDEPWSDIRALGETMRRAYADTNLSDVAHGDLDALFYGMLSDNPSLRFSSVFDLRYTADSVEIPPVRPDVTPENIDAYRSRPPQRAMEAPLPGQQRKAEASERTDAEERTQMNAAWAAIAIGALLLALTGVLVWALLKW